MIKAALSNASHPEYGQVTISFPIPDEQYDQTIEMLQTMELGFSGNRDCMVDDLDSSYSVLKALTDTMVNMRWSYQRRMESGTFNTCKHPLGYRLVGGRLEIFEPEAEIVREIFRQFLCACCHWQYLLPGT